MKGARHGMSLLADIERYHWRKEEMVEGESRSRGRWYEGACVRAGKVAGEEPCCASLGASRTWTILCDDDDTEIPPERLAFLVGLEAEASGGGEGEKSSADEEDEARRLVETAMMVVVL